MKKVFMLSLVFILVFSFNVGAKRFTKTRYSSFDGVSMIEMEFGAVTNSNLALKFDYSILDTIIGSVNKYDILGGFAFDYKGWNDRVSENIIYGGMRIGENENGIVISLDSKTYYDKNVYLGGDTEFVFWQKSDTSSLTTDFLIGYKVSKNLSLECGISWIQSEGESEIGPKLGFQSTF